MVSVIFDKEADMTNEEMYFKLAHRDLLALANDGMKTYHKRRNLLAPRTQFSLEWCESFIGAGPGTYQINHMNCPREGTFAGMNISEILVQCFDAGAIQLLFDNAGNQYQFWKNLHEMLFLGFQEHRSALPLLISCSETARLLGSIQPFGIINDSDPSAANLKKCLESGFDVNKLDPVYAAELLDTGFLLLYVPNKYDGARRLVVSPLYRKLVPGYKLPEDVAGD